MRTAQIPCLFLSPYRADSQVGIMRNVMIARDYCRALTIAGYSPLAPHLLNTQYLDDDIESERYLGIKSGLAWMPFARFVFVMKGEISEGMAQEIAEARSLGIELKTVEMIDGGLIIEAFKEE